jgi:hypothetical protein
MGPENPHLGMSGPAVHPGHVPAAQGARPSWPLSASAVLPRPSVRAASGSPTADTGEDWQFAPRLAHRGRFVCIDQPVRIYLRHPRTLQMRADGTRPTAGPSSAPTAAPTQTLRPYKSSQQRCSCGPPQFKRRSKLKEWGAPTEVQPTHACRQRPSRRVSRRRLSSRER